MSARQDGAPVPALTGPRIATYAVLVLALAAIPFFTEKFYVQFFAKILIMAILAMSLDLLLGYTGLVS